VFRAESARAALAAYGGVERFCVRLAPVVVGTHVTAACLVVSRTSAIPAGLVLAGIVTFAGAIGFWFWGRVMIGPLRERRLPNEPPRQFRCDGAFGLVRHPLYASYLLACAAPLLVAQYPPLLLTFACCALMLEVRARQEERRLHAQLGPQYAVYCREVKRLVPFVW
jgi:protein-S-isoprenylcysteine O-methyltransferase Ste14